MFAFDMNAISFLAGFVPDSRSYEILVNMHFTHAAQAFSLCILCILAG